MSAPKGYPTSQKLERLRAQFATLEPVRLGQFGLSVLAHQFLVVVGTDAVDSATVSVITAAGHAAHVGDVIRFTSGAHSGAEFKVSEVATNTITLSEDLSVAPSAADTFEILRHRYPRLDPATGGLITTTTVSAFNTQFLLDGVDQVVTEDTVTPANNAPLPVKLLDALGNENTVNANARDGAGNLLTSVVAGGTRSLDVAIRNAAGAHIDPAQIRALTSGTDSVAAVQSGTWNINNISGTVSLPTGAATEATLAALSAKIRSFDLDTGAGTEDVTGVNLRLSANGGSVEFGTLTNPVRVDPTGSTTQPVSGTVAATQSGAWSVRVQDGAGTALTSVLAGAAQSLDIAIRNAAGTHIDPTQIRALTSGTDSVAAVQSGVWSVDVNLDVVDFLDTNPVLDSSSTNIPASGSSTLEVVASLAAAVKKIRINDTTGKFIGVYTGAGNGTLQCVIGPGQDGDIEVEMAAAERVSIRHMQNTAISVGELLIQFYG